MDFYIGLDLGTSSVKGVVFDNKGNVVETYLEEYDIISKKSGYAEENPLVWFNQTIKVLASIKDKSKIKGIGISGQMHGLVILDKDDNVLRDSIIWCDNRTDVEAKLIEEKIGFKRLKEITGNIAMPAFTLAKLLWVKNNEPKIYNKIAKVMLPKDYIVYMLTKNHCADYSDISGTQILDITNYDYSNEILESFNIPRNWFGKLVDSKDIAGYLTADIEQLTGLENVFVCAGAGDQAAGAIGNGIISSDDASIVLGSSGVVYSPIDELYIAPNGEVQTFVSANEKKYHVMGVTNGCGTSLKWLRDEMFNIGYNEMTSLAGEISAGSNSLYYLPYLMGERTPILDTYAKGVFFGIKNTTSKGEMIRAVMEGVGYSIKDCFKLIKGKKTNVLISGGGAKSKLYREIIASMINHPIIQIKQDEGAALGAAILAMVAGGEYKSISEACKAIIQIDSVTKPIKEWVDLYEKCYNIYKKIYINTKEIFKEI
ncbi:MAG: xylulokinase [Erysipelotrichaceae bacterium]|nr:xylulokinase [Erysipelotrichaceae bacterium]